MIRILSIHLILISLLFSCSNSQDIDGYLNDIYEDGALNGNVLVAKNGSVIFEKSFGYADGDKSIDLTSDYRFGLGSVYKEFPAVGIMQLVEKGVLTINDPISNYLDDLPAWSNDIMIRHLLRYSSGLPQVDWGQLFQSGEEISEANVLEGLIKLESLPFQPGQGYVYSNYNPFLLMRIIEKTTGKTYRDYLQAHILEPHRLDGIVIMDQYPYEDSKWMAMPFDESFEEDDVEHSLSSICSSARGMYQWFSLLDGYRIISESSIRLLSQTHMNDDDHQSPLGECRWQDAAMQTHQHHGSSGNYECLVSHYPEEGLMIVLMTNQKNGNLHKMTERINKIVKTTY